MSSKQKELRTTRSRKVGCVIRNECRKEPEDVRLLHPGRNPGYLSRWDRGLLNDYDYAHFRARRSSGWKNSRCRRQWEKRVREQEKRLRKSS